MGPKDGFAAYGGNIILLDTQIISDGKGDTVYLRLLKTQIPLTLACVSVQGKEIPLYRRVCSVITELVELHYSLISSIGTRGT